MRVSCFCDSCFQVEFTTIIARAVMRRRNDEVAHRLEACRAGTNHVLVHDGFCRAVVATEHSITSILQMACRPLLVVIARAARPNGTFVEADVILGDATVNEATHVAVTDRQRIREFGTGIAIVPKRKRIVRCCKRTSKAHSTNKRCGTKDSRCKSFLCSKHSVLLINQNSPFYGSYRVLRTLQDDNLILSLWSRRR